MFETDALEAPSAVLLSKTSLLFATEMSLYAQANWLSELGKQQFISETLAGTSAPGSPEYVAESSQPTAQTNGWNKGCEGLQETPLDLGHPSLRANTMPRTSTEDQPSTSGRRGRLFKSEGPASSQGPTARKDPRESGRDRQGKGASSLSRGESLGLSFGTGGPSSRGPRTPRRGSGSQGAGLHIVVRLGWKPLCEVHCNGLAGTFLGGHDRDLYIQVCHSMRCNCDTFLALVHERNSRVSCIAEVSQLFCAGHRQGVCVAAACRYILGRLYNVLLPV